MLVDGSLNPVEQSQPSLKAAAALLFSIDQLAFDGLKFFIYLFIFLTSKSKRQITFRVVLFT